MDPRKSLAVGRRARLGKVWQLLTYIDKLIWELVGRQGPRHDAGLLSSRRAARPKSPEAVSDIGSHGDGRTGGSCSLEEWALSKQACRYRRDQGAAGGLWGADAESTKR